MRLGPKGGNKDWCSHVVRSKEEIRLHPQALLKKSVRLLVFPSPRAGDALRPDNHGGGARDVFIDKGLPYKATIR